MTESESGRDSELDSWWSQSKSKKTNPGHNSFGFNRLGTSYRELNNVHLYVTRPPEICVNLFLNIFTLLTVTQFVDDLFQ